MIAIEPMAVKRRAPNFPLRTGYTSALSPLRLKLARGSLLSKMVLDSTVSVTPLNALWTAGYGFPKTLMLSGPVRTSILKRAKVVFSTRYALRVQSQKTTRLLPGSKRLRWDDDV